MADIRLFPSGERLTSQNDIDGALRLAARSLRIALSQMRSAARVSSNPDVVIRIIASETSETISKLEQDIVQHRTRPID